MQFVNPSHQREVGHRHWPRQVVDAATADAQNLLCLSNDESPYGLKSSRGKLKDFELSIFDTGWRWKNLEHKKAVENFWRKAIDFSGARLRAYSEDYNLVLLEFLSANSLARSQGHVELDCSTAKAEMTLYPRPDPLHTATWLAPMATNIQPKISTQNFSGKIRIGILWKCTTCDFDLHARSRSDEDFLSYKNAKNTSGRFYKDYFSDPQIPYGFEFAEFDQDVDIRQIEALVNFYGGEFNERTREGPDVVVRVTFNEQVTEKKYLFKARSGNGGEKSGSLLNSPHWVRINLLEMLSK